MKHIVVLAGLLALVCTGAAALQDVPVEIPRKELPRSASCVVCESNGEKHKDEKAAAGVRYKGKSYYFCNTKEVAEFKADPEAFMPPVLPRAAKALRLKTLDGAPTSLDNYKGKVVLVDWWATWCAPCVAAMPGVQKVYARYADKGFVAVGISIDDEGAKKVKPFVEKRKFTYPILLDASGQWKTWNIRAVPAMFLLDRSGQIVKQWTGKIDTKEIEAAIEDLVR